MNKVKCTIFEYFLCFFIDPDFILLMNNKESHGQIIPNGVLILHKKFDFKETLPATEVR